MEYNIETIRQWLKENNHRITHFRPKSFCRCEYFLAYDRNQIIPYIDGQPYMPDNDEVYKIIREICGAGKISEKFESCGNRY